MARRAGLALLTLLALTACGNTSSSTPTSSPRPSHSPSRTATAPTTAPSSTAPTTTAPATTTATTSPSATGSPKAVSPGRDLLGWSPVPGPTTVAVTVGDQWTLHVPQGGDSAQLTGPRTMAVRVPSGFRINKAVLDDQRALVVSQSTQADKPDSATVVDLGTQSSYTLDGRSDVPTSVGGTWALGTDRIVHATTGPHRSYCLASVDLGTHAGTVGYCAPKRHGFSRAAVTAAGETLMTFDDHQPSCRTLVTVDGADVTPLPGVTECQGWDALATTDGTVWSVVPNQNRIDAAHYYARSGDAYYDLGPGTSGTLVACGDASYFVRDPHSSTDHADLLRWRAGRLDVVFESQGTGKAFLSAPRCAGSHLTLNAYAAAGDQQVTASVG